MCSLMDSKKAMKMMKNKNILHGPPFHYQFPEGSTIAKLIFNRLKSQESSVAQIQNETGEQLTFDQIFIRSCKLATYLRNNGIKVNDRISICSENNIGWAVPVCASLFIGATICPLNHGFSKREFLHTLCISKPRLIFVSPTVLKSMRRYVKELSWSTKLIVITRDSNLGVPNVDNLIENIPNNKIDNFEVTEVDVNQHIVSILCSSGTTGLPKGVMLTDKNYLMNLQNMMENNIGIATENQVRLCFLPFFHTYCFSILLLCLISGNIGIVFSSFRDEAFLESIEKYKIEVLNLVPPLMVFLAKSPIVDKYDLSSVKVILSGAAPLSREIEQDVKKRLNNPDVRQGYGMTELTLSVTIVPDNCNKVGSVGKLIAGCSAKVLPIDENGKTRDEPLGPNQEGELCFKGDQIMKGYCGDTSSTAATIDEDGWLHTGDIGYYDEDEFFYVVDRLKELIKYKGYQVPPAELEAILLTHPEIKDAAVVGLPDEVAGELPIAFIVRRPNAEITAKDVVKYVDERVSNQKRLRGGVRFVESIPKNPSGKILRRELRTILKSKL